MSHVRSIKPKIIPTSSWIMNGAYNFFHFRSCVALNIHCTRAGFMSLICLAFVILDKNETSRLCYLLKKKERMKAYRPNDLIA